MRKPILCLDFDGVIHSYSSGWKGADVIPDPPVAGALDFIVAACDHFHVNIHSSRSCQPGGIAAMQRYLIDAYMDVAPVFDAPLFVREGLYWPTEKPAAMVTIDDRALTFNGTWPRFEDLLSFQPWNKKPTGATGDFPQGKLNADDEGGLRIAIGVKDGAIMVDFGKPTAWIALDPGTAEALANNLLKHAASLRQ